MAQPIAPPHSTTRTSGDTVVDLPGDIDIGNAWEIRDRLVTLLDGDVSALILNMTTTRFCDCTGIRVLVQVAHYAENLGTPMCVALPADGPVRRVAELTGLARELQVTTGTAAAHRYMRSIPAPAEG